MEVALPPDVQQELREAAAADRGEGAAGRAVAAGSSGLGGSSSSTGEWRGGRAGGAGQGENGGEGPGGGATKVCVLVVWGGGSNDGSCIAS
jgi:hypothetical protein